MKLYEKIKKEYLFIFIVLLTALILFSYFDFSYTSLAAKEVNTCGSKGYSCCLQGTGKGVSYFSLDDTCSKNYECWDYCEQSYTKNSLITGYAFFDDVKNFFNNIFGQKIVGFDPVTSVPSELIATPVIGTSTKIDLKWKDNSNDETNFIIER